MYGENTLNREKVAHSQNFLVQKLKSSNTSLDPCKLSGNGKKYYLTLLSLSIICVEGRGIAFISYIAGKWGKIFRTAKLPGLV
jgi:hypothetical protein